MSPAPALLGAFAKAAVPGYSPADELPGLVAWWDAAAVATIVASGSTFTSITDKISGVVLTSGGGWTTGGTQNGHNYISLAGGASCTTPSIASYSQPYVVIIAGQYTTINENAAIVESNGGDGRAGLVGQGYSGGWLMGAGGFTVSTIGPDTDPHVWCALFYPGFYVMSMRVDGVVSGSLDAGPNRMGGVVYLGGVFGGWKGKLFELMLVSGAPSTDDFLAVEDYLRTKWGTP